MRYRLKLINILTIYIMMSHIAFGYVDDDGIDYELYKHNQFLQQEAQISKKRALRSGVVA